MVLPRVVDYNVLPFAMCVLDTVKNEERGIQPFPENWQYDAKAQVSNIITMEPTLVLSSIQERDSDTKADSED